MTVRIEEGRAARGERGAARHRHRKSGQSERAVAQASERCGRFAPPQCGEQARQTEDAGERDQRVTGKRLPEEIQLREAEQVKQRVVGVKVHRHHAEFQQRAEVDADVDNRHKAEGEPAPAAQGEDEGERAKEKARDQQARHDLAFDRKQEKRPERQCGRKEPRAQAIAGRRRASAFPCRSHATSERNTLGP